MLRAVRRGRVAAVVAAALYAAVVLAAWSSIEDVNDYSGFVAGARAILAGESPYDPATWPTAWERFGTQRPDTSVYGYPGWIALAFIPLAPLPIPLGSLLFTAGTLALAALAARALARRTNAPPGHALILACASWPAFLVFLQGQWDYLLFALAVATYLDLAARRDGRAGVWWSLAALIKPQLFVLGSLALAAWLIRARRWRAIAAAAATSIAAVVVSALVLPGWWTPWLGAVASHRLVRSTQQPTFAGLAGDVAGDAWPAVWGVAVLAGALAVLWAARRSREQRGAVAFAGFLSLSIGGALYSWSYDQYLCLGCGIVALGVASDGPRRTAVTVATLALFLPLALVLWLSAFARYHDTGSGLVPALSILLLVAAAGARLSASSAPRVA
jgi:alpha-1,2-mannosyltransferase